MVKRPTRSSDRKNGSATTTFAVASLCLLLLAAAYMWFLGFGLSPPRVPIGGAFSLTQDGGRVVTERDFRGHYVLIYFGYTACADVCPTTLTAIADAIDILGSRASNLRPVFISVDPKRELACGRPRLCRKVQSQHSGLEWNVGSDQRNRASVQSQQQGNAGQRR